MCVVDMTRRCQSKVHTDDPQNPPPISLSAAGWSYRYVYAGSGMSIFLSRLRLRLCCLASSGRCDIPCFAVMAPQQPARLFALLCDNGADVSAT